MKGEITMANCAKYTRGAMGHLMKHYERAKDENGEYVKFHNQEIDSNKTHLNYNLAPHRQSQLEFLHKRLSEVYCLKRKDVNVMCSWVITAPKELPAERQREFFERSYQFLEKKYGKENVISSYVHMDETQPHMHFAFVPIIYDKKKKREKVSAKEVISKTELQHFHKDFQSEMDKFCECYDFDFECNVLNGATANGNRTIQQLKIENEQSFLDELLQRNNEECSLITNLSEERERLIEDIKTLEVRKSTLEDKLNDLQGKIDAIDNNKKLLMTKFVNQPNIKPIFEKYLMSCWEKYQEKKRAAAAKDNIEPKRKSLADRIADAKEKITQQEEVWNIAKATEFVEKAHREQSHVSEIGKDNFDLER